MVFFTRPLFLLLAIAIAIGYFGTLSYKCQYTEKNVMALQHELSVLEGEIIDLREQLAGKKANEDAVASDNTLLGERWTQKKLKALVEVMPKWEEPEAPDTAHFPGTLSAGTLRMISFNILEGGRNRMGKISKWIASKDPEVVGLSECNGFTEQSLKNLAMKWNHTYSVLGKAKSGYHVALTSKFPIEEVVVDTKWFEHCAVSGVISGMRVMVTHLRPNDPDGRLREANEIGIKDKEATVVMGDFNSLSPLDRDAYLQSHLEHIAKANGHQGKDAKLKKKFTFQGSLDFRLLNLLYSKGFHDLVQEKHQVFVPSVPTKLNQNIDKMNTEHKMRLDYILGSTDVSSRDCEIVKNPNTDTLSDHYPIFCVVEKFIRAP